MQRSGSRLRRSLYRYRASAHGRANPEIGSNGVDVPKRYYKVILDYVEPELKAIGFILPNEKSSLPLSVYAVPVDQVEDVTGLDFFYLLEDGQEERLESEEIINEWIQN